MKQKNLLKIFTRLSLKLLKSQEGAAMIEYGLLVALISLSMVAALKAVGFNLTAFFNFITQTISDILAS